MVYIKNSPYPFFNKRFKMIPIFVLQHQNIYIVQCAQRITMKAIVDAMVLIHLAKITLLEKSCDYFHMVMISELVFNEIRAGKEKGIGDALIVEALVHHKKIKVKKTNDLKMIAMINNFNVYEGEAESVALYKQENADLLITDDQNVRKKKDLMEIKLIGSLAVILKLRKAKIIDKDKFRNAIEKMREIGWFSNAIIDTVLMEGEHYG